MQYQGECHCRAIGYAYRTALAPRQWPIRACQCSFCRAHGARTTSDPSGRVEFKIADDTRLQRYRFGQRTADFLVCSACGVYIGAVIDTENGTFAIVNINVLDPVPEDLGAPQSMTYEGESAEQRVRRREERWTPCERLP